MTNPPPLSASPLRLLAHRFTEIFVKASEQDEPQGGFSLNTSRGFRQHEEKPREYQLILTLELGSSTPDQESPYIAKLTIEGEFEVTDSYPPEKREELIRVTGASILYGACREMLANLTARSTHGMSTLPSVSFASAMTVEKVATKKTGAKKAAKGKSRALD
jgi:preprotein translocase subunit SecB